MAKTESTFINMTLTLVVVTLVAAGLLGTVFALTKEPIRLAELAKKNEAIANVVPGFDNEPSQEVERLFLDGDSIFLYTARKGEEVLGTAVETFTNKDNFTRASRHRKHYAVLANCIVREYIISPIKK